MTSQIRLHQQRSQQLLNWVQDIHDTVEDDFQAIQQIVTRLGAHYHDDLAEFGFWVPELIDANIPDEHIFLECLTATTPINLQVGEQEISFTRDRVGLLRDGEFLWGAVEGLTAGSRDTVGTFYWVVYQDESGKWHSINDHLAYSVPLGVFAPAELYDMEKMSRERSDRDYFHNLDTTPDADGIHRVQPPTNILQIHVGTASSEKTLAGLTQIYRTIASKISDGVPLSPAEENYVGYDAVQLMPIEPPIEHEAGPLFWETLNDTDDERTVKVRQHDIINWGYDVMISASPAPNPSVLSTKRPDELMDFIGALHNFPGNPIKVMFDIVYGHTDNQAIGLLNKHYLAGANMYGQNMNYQHPITRAILLEMQRRKSNYGVDGIRVDGAQDFKWYDRETNQMIHDDDYLAEMNNLVQEVDGHQYRPWMIFEDGRPWPREDWEIASTYRVVTEQHSNVWQWGPLTFAHNTPFLFTFWLQKWWRIREMAEVGSHWITGCANHDTLRRGTQVPIDARMNTYLGDTLQDIIQNGYDNPSAKLFDYAMMPGVPMDFLNASMRAPWGFIRNTDDKYGVKVISEEARFSQWLINAESFDNPQNFMRLKGFGFSDINGLRQFMHTLDHSVQATAYDLPAVARLMSSNLTPLLPVDDISIDLLKQIALAWMEDVHDYCNCSSHFDTQSPVKTAFNLAVREFRRQRPWLLENLRHDEFLDYRHPADGSMIVYGLRIAPDGGEQILFVANMEGAPCTVTPLDLPIPNLPKQGWEVALKTPKMSESHVSEEMTLRDSEGIVFVNHI